MACLGDYQNWDNTPCISSARDLRLISTQVTTQCEEETSNILPQLHANYIGTSFQFIALQDRCDLSRNQPLLFNVCHMSPCRGNDVCTCIWQHFEMFTAWQKSIR